ncbi:MAG TPA: hypothetical protein VGC23_08335 [Vicinamibacterales bacterium]
MGAAISSIHESDVESQALIDEVVQMFIDLLSAGGATTSMMQTALEKSLKHTIDSKTSTNFTDLGSLQRDCMEVMCAWRRDVELVDQDGEPSPLLQANSRLSFHRLCVKANCRHSYLEVLNALLDFGAVSIDARGYVHSETPTFLIGAASAGGRIATDGLIKQVQSYLLSVHRNVRSVSGVCSPRFERACTVTVAAELEPIFERLVRSRGQEFIDSIDEWLERNLRVESPTGVYMELGAGAYYIDRGVRHRRDGESASTI